MLEFEVMSTLSTGHSHDTPCTMFFWVYLRCMEAEAQLHDIGYGISFSSMAEVGSIKP